MTEKKEKEKQPALKTAEQMAREFDAELQLRADLATKAATDGVNKGLGLLPKKTISWKTKAKKSKGKRARKRNK